MLIYSIEYKIINIHICPHMYIMFTTINTTNVLLLNDGTGTRQHQSRVGSCVV